MTPAPDFLLAQWPGRNAALFLLRLLRKPASASLRALVVGEPPLKWPEAAARRDEEEEKEEREEEDETKTLFSLTSAGRQCLMRSGGVGALSGWPERARQRCGCARAHPHEQRFGRAKLGESANNDGLRNTKGRQRPARALRRADVTDGQAALLGCEGRGERQSVLALAATANAFGPARPTLPRPRLPFCVQCQQCASSSSHPTSPPPPPFSWPSP